MLPVEEVACLKQVSLMPFYEGKSWRLIMIEAGVR